MSLRRVLVVLLVSGAALAGCTAPADPADAVRAAASAYLAAWSDGDYAKAAALTDDVPGATALLTMAGKDLGVAAPTAKAGKVAVTGSTATAQAAVSWALPGTPSWDYTVALSVADSADGWVVQVAPTLIHPDLQAGQGLARTRTLPERASILDAAGIALFSDTPVVTVGVDPGKVTDLTALADSLAQVLDVTAADIVRDVSAAPPGQFVPVITLREPDYQAVKAQIYDVPGTVFNSASQQLAPTSLFARAVLGRVGPVTAELVSDSDGLLVAGDTGGLSGLQRAYQKQLTGTAGFSVSSTGPAAADGTAGAVVRELGSVAPLPGQPLATTLDSSVESAADAAVATLSQPSYIVAVRPSTGELLAVASNAAATAANALTGQFPAGSTFKIITASAALAARGLTPDTPVACPASTTVDGKEFENEDRFDLGEVSLQTAFAQSCNSTFTALGITLPAAALPDTAAQFGIGAPWSLPLDTFSGALPVPASQVVQAADSIGQGQVLVSPFAMAYVAATAAAGATPVLVPSADSAGTAPAAPSAAVLQTLRPMMRAVVTEGTARGLSGVAGEVFGKTGTAEFGTGDPPPAHAWFVGYRGDLAFAVFVEGGQSSGTTAVPLADAFLTALPG